jgi:FKBP-type peptidyl-prolyl cis-trans isomerase SlyD
MQIEKNKVVTVHYRLQDENADGELIETTFDSDPLVFLFGVGQMIPEFERQLLGKVQGDMLSFRIDAADAYGEFDEDALVELPMDVFMIDGELAEELLEVGKQIPMADQNGNRLVGIVDEIREDSVLMDFNHPMAGTNLFFEVQVQSVREATQEEMEHGHVHGPGGHHH